jgi:hypothetical protein
MESFLKSRNYRYLLRQAFWGGGFNAYLIFTIPFLVRLGASITLISFYVGLTSLGRLLIGPIVIIHLEDSSHKRLWLVIAGTLSRGSLLVAAAAPLFGHWKATYAASVFILFAIPTIIFSAVWVPVPGITVDLHEQPKILSDRIRLANAGSLTANVLYAVGMFFLPFPSNFIYIFVLSSCMGAVEISAVSQMQIYSESFDRRRPFVAKFRGQKLGGERDYLIFIGGIGLAIASVSIALPLQSVYFLKDLKFSDRWLSMWAILLNVGAVAGITLWKQVQKKVGSYAIFSRTIVMASFYFLLIATVENKFLLLLIAMLFGMVDTGTDLGITLGLYRLGSDTRRDLLINIYIGVTVGVSFVAAFFLNFFTDRFALTTIFFGTFALRFVVASAFRLPSWRAKFSDRPELVVTQAFGERSDI